MSPHLVLARQHDPLNRSSVLYRTAHQPAPFVLDKSWQPAALIHWRALQTRDCERLSFATSFSEEVTISLIARGGADRSERDRRSFTGRRRIVVSALFLSRVTLPWRCATSVDNHAMGAAASEVCRSHLRGLILNLAARRGISQSDSKTLDLEGEGTNISWSCCQTLNS